MGLHTEAFQLIGKLMQNTEVIKEIVLTKKGFRVRWVLEPHLFNYKFTPYGVESFLELYESYEEQVKRMKK